MTIRQPPSNWWTSLHSVLGDIIPVTYESRARYAALFVRTYRNLYGDTGELAVLSDYIRRGILSSAEAVSLLRGTLSPKKQWDYSVFVSLVESGFVTLDDLTVKNSRLWHDANRVESITLFP